MRSTLRWSLPDVADEAAAILEALEADLRLEQAPHGLDELDERSLQAALAAGLRRRFEVALEAGYPSGAGLARSRRRRCDLVLSPRGQPLRGDGEILPLGSCAPEDALWIELKLARQLRPGGAPHQGYGTQWRRQLVADLRKMGAEPLIREAALALVAFTEDETVLGRDLERFETVLAGHELLAGFRQVRHVAILDRIGHRVCAVAFWPTVQRSSGR